MKAPPPTRAAGQDGGRILWRTARERRRVAARVLAAVERYRAEVSEAPIEPVPGRGAGAQAARAAAAAFDFAGPMDPCEAVDRVVSALRAHQVHTSHPGYFGLFNPAPSAMGIAADALVAAFNPQLASYGHSPFAVEVERHLVRAFAEKLGLASGVAGGDAPDGTFTSGGAEANHTALLVALQRAFPEARTRGLRALPGPPALYVSSETHDSLVKAAVVSGLGTEAVHVVPTDGRLRLDVAALEARIAADRAAGWAPFLVVATAGTTSAGVIDPLDAIAACARRHGLWLHVDAAWGGAAALLPELAGALRGIGEADSVTLDAHKWLSVPMGAGLLLTRHPAALEATFRVAAAYMPAARSDTPDPFARSLQWSRRFIGLKVLLSLAVAGWDGYAAVLRHQVAMGQALRARLAAAGWRVVNDTPLPLVCFVDGARPDGADVRYLGKARRVAASAGRSWISVTRLGVERAPALRACITHYATGEEDLDRLVRALGEARAGIAPSAGGVEDDD